MPYYIRGSSLTHPVFTMFLVCIFSIVLDLIYCFVNLAWPRCTVFAKSTAVHGMALGLHIHSHSPTRPERLPVLQAPFVVSALDRRTNFFFYTILCCTFSMFRQTNTILLQLLCATYCMLYRLVAQEQVVPSYSLGVRWAIAARCV